MSGWHLENTYAQLPSSLFARVLPERVPEPRIVVLNEDLAEQIGLDVALLHREGAAIFGGNKLPTGSEPIAQAYAGHQFGYFTMLGDGRAILLGEHMTLEGERFDIQLKGAGRTPYSRRGDGKATLGPMLREYIIGEAMYRLGIPTTRSLAVVTTGEKVCREADLPGAVLTRVAASHLRVGTFEFARATGDLDLLKTLADYAISRHYPECQEDEQPYLRFLEQVIERQAALIAKWLLVGFVHGVMNTDNMAISGETIDYGPCAFMDWYSPTTVFSSIDSEGRYAYGNQPSIAKWNLSRFAETLLPLLNSDPREAFALGQEAIGKFLASFREFWLAGMRAKLGLSSSIAGDEALIDELFDVMEEIGMDYTNTFCALMGTPGINAEGSNEPRFLAWIKRWEQRLGADGLSLKDVLPAMRAHNPIVIPRNKRVEEALARAVDDNDLGLVNRLLDALASPYRESGESIAEYLKPAPHGTQYKTFCGT